MPGCIWLIAKILRPPDIGFQRQIRYTNCIVKLLLVATAGNRRFIIVIRVLHSLSTNMVGEVTTDVRDKIIQLGIVAITNTSGLVQFPASLTTEILNIKAH